ncbi:MAG: PAS domain-containing protein [Nocardioides sp.]|nr:PAS domain-containing protein [Nocardioides sp.]
MFDDEGRTTYANDQMAALLGLAPDQLLGFTVLDVLDVLDALDALDEQGRSDFTRHLHERTRSEEPGHDLEVYLWAATGASGGPR